MPRGNSQQVRPALQPRIQLQRLQLSSADPDQLAVTLICLLLFRRPTAPSPSSDSGRCGSEAGRCHRIRRSKASFHSLHELTDGVPKFFLSTLDFRWNDLFAPEMNSLVMRLRHTAHLLLVGMMTNCEFTSRTLTAVNRFIKCSAEMLNITYK